MNRIGSFIQTITGKLFWPLDPRPDEVEVEAIAHSLSQMCRWTGHSRQFYSVAQHACVVSDLVRPLAPHLALAALHHDSAEAYLSDICSPTKQFLYLRYEDSSGAVREESFTEAEHRIEQVIFEALGIQTPSATGRATIKTADLAALRYEQHHLMSAFPAEDPIYSIGLIGREWTCPWDPSSAKRHFIQRHNELKAANAL